MDTKGRKGKQNSSRDEMNLPSLPCEIQCLISSFLCTIDALRYSTCNRRIKDALNFGIVHSANTIEQQLLTSNSFYENLFPTVPILSKHALHTYRIRCSFCGDFAWTFFIKNCEDELVALYVVDKDHRDIVFSPKMNQNYFLCYRQQDDFNQYGGNLNVKITFHVDILAHEYVRRFPSNKLTCEEDRKQKLSSQLDMVHCG
mmetsp:Transcript_25323/g.31206  ORF Transcript_25323/g.31206 Transcript_25323/m.31206 type:complete len:201 (+) Transcript_25323:142-744(+)